jgi:transmembrane sensor
MNLGRHITPEVDEARLARQRSAINERVAAAKGKKARWLWALAPAVCAAVLAVLLLRPHSSSAVTAGTIVEAPAGTALPMTLLDGSRVVLDPESRLGLMTLLPKEIRLELTHGALQLDVTHVEGREFVVVASGYEVRVLGTLFAVKIGADALEVKVTRGRVRVTRIGDPSDLRVLSAGETWSSSLGAKAEAPASSEPPPEAVPDPAPSATTPSATTPRIGAKELWSQAESARAAKRFQDEATALNSLRLRHRSDPRAGLAAFQLGRLRQDALHDPAGAAEAFADAIALAPNGPFREDAEARRVEALDAAGREALCSEAKSQFLARYPASIHRQRVSGMCQRR